MIRLGLLIGLCVIPMVLSGCGTIEGMAHGVKKDANAVYKYVSKEDGWMRKTDDWMREHLW